MAGLGLQGGFGLAGAQDELKQLLARRFMEQMTRQKLAQDQAEMEMRQAIAQQQLAQGDRRIGQDERELTERSRQFDVTSGFKGRELGLEEQLQPVRLAHMGAQTADIQRRPQAEQQEREFVTGRDETQHQRRLAEIGATQAGQQRLARLQASLRPQTTGGPDAKAERAQAYQADRTALAIDKIDKILPRINAMTAGPLGNALTHIPGTEATNVNAELVSLASNVGFAELTAMRNSSQTGGALGQVSDKEGELLQSVLGSIRQDQSPANLRLQLQQMREILTRWQAAQVQLGGEAAAQPAAAAADDPAARAAALLKKYGGL